MARPQPSHRLYPESEQEGMNTNDHHEVMLMCLQCDVDWPE